MTSLKVWKRGESSLPYIQGQAAITAAIFIRFSPDPSVLSYRLSHVGVAHETQVYVESKVFIQVSQISCDHLVFASSMVLTQLS